MREIEIKARVANFGDLLDHLTGLGIVFSDEIKQHDVVYGQANARDNDANANWLRVRTENDSIVYFTLKRSVVGHLDSLEHEVTVSDASEITSIIQELGFELYSDLTKIRRKAKYKDIEICLDEVPSLGSFIELEKILQKDADHDAVVSELWELLESFGVSKTDEVHEGYDVLERRNRGIVN